MQLNILQTELLNKQLKGFWTIDVWFSFSIFVMNVTYPFNER